MTASPFDDLRLFSLLFLFRCLFDFGGSSTKLMLLVGPADDGLVKLRRSLLIALSLNSLAIGKAWLSLRPSESGVTSSTDINDGAGLAGFDASDTHSGDGSSGM
jgi:hypothetical protein